MSAGSRMSTARSPPYGSLGAAAGEQQRLQTAPLPAGSPGGLPRIRSPDVRASTSYAITRRPAAAVAAADALQRPSTSAFSGSGSLLGQPSAWSQHSPGRPSTSTPQLRTSSALLDGSQRPSSSASGGDPSRKPRQPARRAAGGGQGPHVRRGSSSNRALAALIGSSAVKDFVKEPSVQTEMLRDILHEWMRGWDDEEKSYSAVSVYAQLRLHEAELMTTDLQRPHPVHCASVCHVFERIIRLFGRYEELLLPLWREILGCVYADAHALPTDPTEAVSVYLVDMEPWFARCDRVSRRSAQLEEQVARVHKQAAEAAGVAQARDAQLMRVVGAWQKELVRIRSLGAEELNEQMESTIRVLESQVRELTTRLQTLRRELSEREDALNEARLDAAKARAEANKRGIDVVRKLFAELPATERLLLAQEFARAVKPAATPSVAGGTPLGKPGAEGGIGDGMFGVVGGAASASGPHSRSGGSKPSTPHGQAPPPVAKCASAASAASGAEWEWTVPETE